MTDFSSIRELTNREEETEMKQLHKLKKKALLVILLVSMIVPSIQVVGLYCELPVAYAATSGVQFIYKKGNSVDGRGDARFHYLKKGKPTIKLKGLAGASESKKVKIKLYSGRTYYGAVSFAKTGNQQYSSSVPQGKYYLVVSGGCGDKNGWVSGNGTIGPIYK